MNSAFTMVINDLSKFDLLSEDMKRRVIKAAAATVNIQAALTRKNAIEAQHLLFHTRNTFTARQTQYTSCPENVTSLADVQSSVGATEKAAYMEQQEHGGIHTPHKGGLLSIPTDAAREGGTFAGTVSPHFRKAGLKKEKVKGPYRHPNASARSRAVARAYIAEKHGLTVHYGKNVFTVSSFAKSGDSISFEKTLVRQVELPQTIVKPRPWLRPASEKPAQDCQSIFNSQMEKVSKM